MGCTCELLCEAKHTYSNNGHRCTCSGDYFKLLKLSPQITDNQWCRKMSQGPLLREAQLFLGGCIPTSPPARSTLLLNMIIWNYLTLMLVYYVHHHNAEKVEELEK